MVRNLIQIQFKQLSFDIKLITKMNTVDLIRLSALDQLTGDAQRNQLKAIIELISNTTRRELMNIQLYLTIYKGAHQKVLKKALYKRRAQFPPLMYQQSQKLNVYYSTPIPKSTAYEKIHSLWKDLRGWVSSLKGQESPPIPTQKHENSQKAQQTQSNTQCSKQKNPQATIKQGSLQQPSQQQEQPFLRGRDTYADADLKGKKKSSIDQRSAGFKQKYI